MDDELPVVEADGDSAVSGGGAQRAQVLASTVPAGFWKRTSAAATDTGILAAELALLSFIVLILTAVVAAIAAGNKEVPADQVPWVQMIIAIVILQVIFSWLYSALFQTSEWQATLRALRGISLTDHGPGRGQDWG